MNRLIATLLLLALATPALAQEGLSDRADVASALSNLESRYQDYVNWQIQISQIPAPPFEEAERATFLASE
ncbi:MAG: outer membrane lipoprotein-sorting protein, partial [Thalassolituus oleivorans]